ncbi:hypothetical protein PoB_003513500 [Plakobranchus ocellatus]|uniref:Uncharacterized protein n=1 Tax=Plakobranchus ocellatus TaxID=259542 RepID=A0AAV4AMQ2_9GAST|nr:hypothetical protein PoB_003513500 [Plakobranchus ocellatus]
MANIEKDSCAPQTRSAGPGERAEREPSKLNGMEDAGPTKKRPYSVAPGTADPAQAQKMPNAGQSREATAEEQATLGGLAATLNSSFTGPVRKNSFGPSAVESRRSSYQMDSRKSTMIGSRRSTMLSQGGTVVKSPDGRRSSFPPAADDSDPMLSVRSSAPSGKGTGGSSLSYS